MGPSSPSCRGSCAAASVSVAGTVLLAGGLPADWASAGEVPGDGVGARMPVCGVSSVVSTQATRASASNSATKSILYTDFVTVLYLSHATSKNCSEEPLIEVPV